MKIIPRAAELLDYTPGGADDDIGAADEIHGEFGDDFIYGMVGDDVLFGEEQNDVIFGGNGKDRISGGTGQDSIFPDDGRTYPSRNGKAEPLYDIGSFTDELNQYIYMMAGKLKKTDNMTPFKLDDTKAFDYKTQHLAQAHDNMVYGYTDGGVSDAPDTQNADDDRGTDGGVNDAPDMQNADDNRGTNSGVSDAPDTKNTDDNRGTNGGVNDAPDMRSSNEDISYGGAGQDVLIDNTGGDRLIDWAGEFNSFIVPLTIVWFGHGKPGPVARKHPRRTPRRPALGDLQLRCGKRLLHRRRDLEFAEQGFEGIDRVLDGETVSVYHVDEILPAYYEIQAVPPPVSRRRAGSRTPS
jgi:hypothetical protein